MPKKKKILSLQLRAWALKLPSMKSPELRAWAPNDFQSPQGPKPKSPSIHPYSMVMISNHYWFSKCVYSKEKKIYCGLFSFKIKNHSSSRISKIQNFENTFSNCA